MTRPLRTGLDVARDVGRCRASALIPLSGGMRAEGAMLMSTGRAASALEAAERFLRDEELLLRPHAELREMTERVNSRGMTWVRRVIDDVEPLLETALEGLAWAAITAAGLVNARPQQWVFGRSGRRYRVDFLIGGNVVLEADGSGKYSEQTPWQEKQRSERIGRTSRLKSSGVSAARAATMDASNRLPMATTRNAVCPIENPPGEHPRRRSAAFRKRGRPSNADLKSGRSAGTIHKPVRNIASVAHSAKLLWTHVAALFAGKSTDDWFPSRAGCRP